MWYSMKSKRLIKSNKITWDQLFMYIVIFFYVNDNWATDLSTSDMRKSPLGEEWTCTVTHVNWNASSCLVLTSSEFQNWLGKSIWCGRLSPIVSSFSLSFVSLFQLYIYNWNKRREQVTSARRTSLFSFIIFLKI